MKIHISKEQKESVLTIASVHSIDERTTWVNISTKDYTPATMLELVKEGVLHHVGFNTNDYFVCVLSKYVQNIL